jgi:hypothetical protein
MLQVRKFNIVWVSRDKKAGQDLPQTIDKKVTYSGKAIAIKRN